MSTDTKGASSNERLLAAARTDDLEMLQEVFEGGEFDINFQDGLGNTALHYAASHGSTDVLDEILSQEGCDVDPINRIEKATPLHLALKLEQFDLRKFVVENLLDAGAAVNVKDKHGDTALDLATDPELKALLRKTVATGSVSRDDIADDDDDDDDDDIGSGSEE